MRQVMRTCSEHFGEFHEVVFPVLGVLSGNDFWIITVMPRIIHSRRAP
jgi:hypothetical protein